jgi:hypothetical protein
MHTQFIVLFIALFVMAIGQQGNALQHQPQKSRKHCDTAYFRGEDVETGEYFLIMEITCDTIEPTDSYPVVGGVGEP